MAFWRRSSTSGEIFKQRLYSGSNFRVNILSEDLSNVILSYEHVTHMRILAVMVKPFGATEQESKRAEALVNGVASFINTHFAFTGVHTPIAPSPVTDLLRIDELTSPAVRFICYNAADDVQLLWTLDLGNDVLDGEAFMRRFQDEMTLMDRRLQEIDNRDNEQP